MPGLHSLLSGYEPDMIHMIARHWGVDLPDKPIEQLREDLFLTMNDPSAILETIQALSQKTRGGLQALVSSGGRITSAKFSQLFGEIREMGAGKRARVHPEENPISPAEHLFYYGLIGKSFLDESPQPQEYVYIPDEILRHVPAINPVTGAPPGRPALPGEHKVIIPASDILLQDACTLLAGLRMGKRSDSISLRSVQPDTLIGILKSAKIVNAEDQPQSEPIRKFLEGRRGEALLSFMESWRTDSTFNELAQIKELILEGHWRVDVVRVRTILLDTLQNIPHNTWWSLNSLIEHFRKNAVDFLRPDGDYDSWFIRDAASGEYLRGVMNWEMVEGRLIRFFFTGIFHWFGLTDLGMQSGSTQPTSFCRSKWGEGLLKHQIPPLTDSDLKVRISTKGQIFVPYGTHLSVRYLLSRYSEWDGPRKGEYQYHLTARSLEEARKNGLKTSMLVRLLAQHCSTPLPPTLNQALHRWEKIGPQSHFQKASLLIVEQPAMIESLRKSSAKRFLGMELNPNTIVIKPGGEQILQESLLELGFFSDSELDG